MKAANRVLIFQCVLTKSGIKQKEFEDWFGDKDGSFGDKQQRADVTV